MLQTNWIEQAAETSPLPHSLQDVGNVISVKQEHNVFQLTCEHAYVSILFFNETTARVIMSPNHIPSLQTSSAVIAQQEDVLVSFTEQEDAFILTTDQLMIHIQKNPCRISFYDGKILLLAESMKGMAYHPKKGVICYKETSKEDSFYGFGEKTGFLDKKGTKMEMWNTDVPEAHNPETDALYQTIPFFITLQNERAHGIFFDNTSRTTFDLQTEETTYSFSASSGQLDYYFFCGPTMKDVITQYTHVTGRINLPPKWSLGYHQSRWGYKTEEDVRNIVRLFKEKGIPLDVLHLDIDYMDGYRVFTFDSERFPNPEKLITELKEQGVNVVPIVDPGIKHDVNYPAYREGVKNDMFCKHLEGNIFFGHVWPGESAFPDFTNNKVREWWGEKHRFYTDLGVEGVWNDMNEPSVFNTSKTMDENVIHQHDNGERTHGELHNVYGFYENKATYEGLKKQLQGKRPFILTRAGYSGIQRYAAVWTGDNRSYWEHLELLLPMCMNMGLSGVPFVGSDVGGFAHDTTEELLTRWTQVGAFSPFFRNHAHHLATHQEPWAFGQETEDIVKKYIQLRYIWLPHLYTLFHEASLTGLPVMRPMVLEYPEDKNVQNISNQFMIGSNVIIAPVLRPTTYQTMVYLPEGTWVNYWTEEKLEGNNYHIVEANLDTLPIFIKAGSILVHGEAKENTKVEDTLLTVHVYCEDNGESSFTLYDDDGKTFNYEENIYLLKKITGTYSDKEVNLTIEDLHTTFIPSWKEMNIILHDLKNRKVTINGEEVHTTEDCITISN